jgi:hypothetical protein
MIYFVHEYFFKIKYLLLKSYVKTVYYQQMRNTHNQ